MRGRKILAVTIALAMVFSAIVLISNNLEVSATPGHDEWGVANIDLTVFEEYDSGEIEINTTGWAADTYYLYYPIYREDTFGSADQFTWSTVPYKVGDPAYSVQVDATPADDDPLDTGGNAITFNCSGMWIFDDDATHDGNDSTSYEGFIWVNTSAGEYSIDVTDEIYYNGTSDLEIEVTKISTGAAVGCVISVLDPDGKTVYHQYHSGGAVDLESSTFEKAGEYTVHAYRDMDGNQPQTYFYPDGETDYEAYTTSYGSGASFPIGPDDDYNYSIVGPFDPPEYNATHATFEVDTGVPVITATNVTPVYWGRAVKIEVNVTDYDGIGISDGTLRIRKGSTSPVYYNLNETPGDDAGNNLTTVTVHEEDNPGDYTIEIPKADPLSATNWTTLVNGTKWYLVFSYDRGVGDGTDEWNNTMKFEIKGGYTDVDLKIVNDGWSTTGTATDKKIDVSHTDPGANGPEETTTIVFQIIGSEVTGVRAFYGDDAEEDRHNITVSGDILYPVTDATLTYNGGTDEWSAVVIPTKPGGTITIAVDWAGKYNGSDSETINIINGTHVTTNIDEFTVGEHVNLTVTVRDIDGDAIKTADVYLFWKDGGAGTAINSTKGDNSEGNGKDGKYTFWIKPSEQGNTAPENITIAANWPDAGGAGDDFWGYATVKMNKNHNMMVNCTPTSGYAGDTISYEIEVVLIGGGNPEAAGLTIELYDMDGNVITGDDELKVQNDHTIEVDHELSGGTYQVYAYNDTHDSAGNNATITIEKYSVDATPDVLAWLIDTEQNMTFEVTPAGNGTLWLQNVSGTPNASDTTVADPGEDIEVENGVATLIGLNASTIGNITFQYQPESGEARPAIGLVQITTAIATPVPPTIYLGESTNVVITLTHPATGLPIPDILVGIDEDKNLSSSILSKLPTSTETDSNGQVAFGLTAEATGEATIFIKGSYDPDNEYVIEAEIKKTLVIDADPSVNEGEDFIVTITDSLGNPVENAVVEFDGDFYTTDADGETDPIEAPYVQVTIDYDIDATATGYTSASDSIKVINMPELFIVGPSKVTGDSFTITAGGDDGNGNGILVTIYKGGTELTSGTTVNGKVTFSVGSKWKAGTYTAKATKTGYAPSDEISIKIEEAGTPGFELLTLIAALGVAFILLRRRRR